MPIRSLTDSGRRLTEADIAAFEKEIGATLPAPYRDFLSRHNGGRPEPAKFHERTLEIFLIIGNDPEEFSNMHNAIENLRGDLPDGVIPIAWDVSDDAIVLALTGENRGRVYRWKRDGQAPAIDHRKRYPHLNWEGYEFKPDDWPGHPDLKLYAEDFDQFLESFYDPEDERF